LPITAGDILARPPSVTARKLSPHPLAHNPDVRRDKSHPRSYEKQKKENKVSGKGTQGKSNEFFDTHSQDLSSSRKPRTPERRKRHRLPTAQQYHRETSESLPVPLRQGAACLGGKSSASQVLAPRPTHTTNAGRPRWGVKRSWSRSWRTSRTPPQGPDATRGHTARGAAD
jgi:hypothetical protein